MVDDSLTRYLETLRDYCAQVTVLGFGMPAGHGHYRLDQIFVEPLAEERLRLPSMVERLAWAEDEPDREELEERLREEAQRRPPPQPVLQVLGDNERAILMGDPGLGKTTICRYLALQAARRRLDGAMDEPLPVLAELRHWEGEELLEGLRAALPRAVEDATDEAAWLDITEAVERGNALLLLDGLDEAAEARSQVLEALTRELRAGRCPRVLLTTRHCDPPSEPEWSDIPIFCLNELRPDAVEDLAGQLCPDEDRRQRLLQFARGHGATLCRIPLFLGMMAKLAAHADAKELPRTRAGAMERYFDLMAGWERDKDADAVVLDNALLRRALGPLALELRLREREGLDNSVVTSALRRAECDDPQAGLAYLDRTVLYRQANRFHFSYEVVLDYFAACGLADSEQPFERIRGRQHWPDLRWVIPVAAGLMLTRRLPRGWQIEDWWQGVLARCGIKRVGGGKGLAAAGDAISGFGAGAVAAKAIGKTVDAVEVAPAHWRRSADYFIERIRRAGSRYDRILHRDLILAVRCAAECRSLQRPTLRPLLPAAAALRRWPWPVRTSVLRETAHCVHHTHLRDRLLELTRGEEWRLRVSAVGVLSSVAGEPAVRERLLELTWDENSWVRERAAKALSSAVREPAVRDRLLALTRDEDWDVRSSAAKALSSAVREPAVRDRLLALTRDEDWDVRSSAAKALSSAAGEPAVRERLLALMRDEDADVRTRAAEALSLVAGEAAVRQRLLKLMRDEDSRMRDTAAKALSSVAGEPAVRDRLLALTRDEDWDVCSSAAKALSSAAGEPAVRDRLLELTGDEHDLVRRTAARALSSVAGEGTVRDRLLALTRDTVIWVRVAAAGALWSVAVGPAVRRRMLALTRDQDWLRERAAEALSSAAGERAARERPLALTRDGRPDVRSQAAAALLPVARDPAVRGRLLVLTQDKHPQMRECAAEALSSVAGEPAVRDQLLELTRDEDWWVRRSAAWALSEAAPAIALLDALSKLARKFEYAADSLDTLLQKAERLAQERGMTLEQHLDSV